MWQLKHIKKHMNSVEIGNLGEIISAFLSKNNYSKIVVLADEKTKKYCYSALKNTLGVLGTIPKHEIIQIKSGEQNKNLESCSKIWQQMTASKLDRHALMINLGGGVIGDMGGFCAAAYKRGIDFIQIPVLAVN
jgi:3-dehydroquinate synthase